MPDAMVYAITAIGGFLALNVVLFLWNPRVKWKTLHGKNGENNLFHIAVDPNARFPRAELAQEIAERRWKIMRGFGIPGLQLILQRIPAMSRARELWGHECKVQAAVLIYGQDSGEYRRSEAWTMANSDSYQFDGGWTSENIYSVMVNKHSRKARKWVRRNLKLIERA